ncbi:MAG: glutathione S-transferase N-terminal domain-containing protein [Gammaproteobacteria bacterium]
MLKIYGYAESINVRKVLWACDEIDLPFERIDRGGRFASVSEPAFRALNPVGMVPVIDDGGSIVWESNAIVRYLCSSAVARISCQSSLQVARRSSSGWTGRSRTSTTAGA